MSSLAPASQESAGGAPASLLRWLTRGGARAPVHAVSEIGCRVEYTPMRDGVRLAGDLYMPPVAKAPVIVLRTPYGRGTDKHAGLCLTLARRGYAVLSQDCRGTGDSEPDEWAYYVYEAQDGYDLTDWISRQSWSDGFIGAIGGSYAGQTQWCMAMHEAMSAIAPEVSGLGVAVNSIHWHMFVNAYARSVGKGGEKLSIPLPELEAAMLPETLATGLFNEPLEPPFSEALRRRFPEITALPPPEARKALWRIYASLDGNGRAQFVRDALEAPQVSIAELEAMPRVFGQHIAHDAHTLPAVDPVETIVRLNAPPLMITGWYDWGLNDALATWALLQDHARSEVRERSRLLITPGSHGGLGYREGLERYPELQRHHRSETLCGVLLEWFDSVRGHTTDAWPKVIYYLMGANVWRTAAAWPPPEAGEAVLYLGADGVLSPGAPEASGADRYVYDPSDPTPTVGGSILSHVYPAGSVDVAGVQGRADVLVYTTPPLARDLDVVGPLRMTLYASSSAVDTDFCVRLSDVEPGGRAIQIQGGVLRARHRTRPPARLTPGEAVRLEIDMWATAHRFAAGRRLRLDISSSDFPRFDRNSNRGGEPGPPAPAMQTVFHGADAPSHLRLSILGTAQEAFG